MKFRISFLSMIAALVWSFSFVAGVQAESDSGRTLSNSEALNTAERWATVVAQADIAGLNELLHADYVHVHATALVESKTKFIEALQTGARKYDPIKIEDSNVRIFGSTAVVSGKFVLRATTRDRVIEGVNRFLLLIVNTPSGVQVASFQATGIPQAK
ncbi:MAG: nuclear transport factor 2 family protein [Betaproteobacteria bacterium]